MGRVASNESSGKEEEHEIDVISSPRKIFIIKVIFLDSYFLLKNREIKCF